MQVLLLILTFSKHRCEYCTMWVMQLNLHRKNILVSVKWQHIIRSDPAQPPNFLTPCTIHIVISYLHTSNCGILTQVQYHNTAMTKSKVDSQFVVQFLSTYLIKYHPLFHSNPVKMGTPTSCKCLHHHWCCWYMARSIQEEKVKTYFV